jgi:hypothetical protein
VPVKEVPAPVVVLEQAYQNPHDRTVPRARGACAPLLRGALCDESATSLAVTRRSRVNGLRLLQRLQHPLHDAHEVRVALGLRDLWPWIRGRPLG